MNYKLICVGAFVFMLTACSPTVENVEEESIQSEEVEESHLSEQLLLAAEEGNINQVEALLKDGVDIDIKDQQGNTAVLLATQNNHVELVQLLIENGANINSQNDNLDNVLLYAGAEGLVDIIELAIDAGADTRLTNRFGGTALIPAADRGHVEAVQLLLEKSDVDIDHMNRLHWTALLEAVILGDGGKKHQEIVQLLIDHGADVSITDGDGMTSLQHAKNSGYKEMIDMLEKASQ